MRRTENAAGEPRNDGGAVAPRDTPPTLNPESLPPVEAIGAATDVRGFLKPGVPADLARAALRRAWASDPAIRDFIGIADNQWDFTKPDGVPGFGPLRITPDLERLLTELFGDVRPARSSAAVEPDQMKADPIEPKDTQSEAKIEETVSNEGPTKRSV